MTDHLKERLSVMNTACGPAPHRYVALVRTFDPVRDECFAHGYFAPRRKMKEFFQVTAEEVEAVFVNYIEAEHRTELLKNAPYM